MTPVSLHAPNSLSFSASLNSRNKRWRLYVARPFREIKVREPLKTEKRLSAYSNEPLRSLLSLNNMQFSAHQLYFGVIHVNALANRSRQFNEIIF